MAQRIETTREWLMRGRGEWTRLMFLEFGLKLGEDTSDLGLATNTSVRLPQ